MKYAIPLHAKNKYDKILSTTTNTILVIRMKKKLLFSMSLLFMGVSMQAQSVDAQQMDERFNDGTKMPY